MKNSIHESISSTELARHLATCIDKVRMSGRSIYITKGSQTIAKISPPPKVGLSIENLAALLRVLPKLEKDAESMSKDIAGIKGHAKLPENPWD